MSETEVFAIEVKHYVDAAGVDATVIALWLGHERVDTTQIYLHADLSIKERALARTTPPHTTAGRYRPPDTLLAFLEASEYADPTAALTAPGNASDNRVGITRRSA